MVYRSAHNDATEDTSGVLPIDNGGSVMNVDPTVIDAGFRSTPSLPARPNLLGIPLEIRHKIFAHFLLFDQILKYQQGDYIPFSFEVLWICRQIRQEAWHYLSSSNSWVQVGVYAKEGKNIQESLTETEECIPPKRFPADMLRDLLQHQLMTIQVGFDCGLKKLPENAVLAQRLVIPYNKWTWLGLCSTLRDKIGYYNNFSFDLGSKYKDDTSGSSLSKDILFSLTMIRRATRVRFTQLMTFPLFNTMSSIMTKAHHRPEDLHELVLGTKEMGDQYLGSNDPEAASYWYGTVRRGANIIYHYVESMQPDWEAYSPTHIALLSLTQDILTSTAAASLDVIKPKLARGASLKDGYEMMGQFENNLDPALDWPGLSDEQRMHSSLFPRKEMVSAV